jgi:hypothetical protein
VQKSIELRTTRAANNGLYNGRAGLRRNHASEFETC